MDKEPPLGVSWSAWAPPRSHLAATPQEDSPGWAEEGKASPSLVTLILALCSGKAAHLSPLPLAHLSLRIWGKKENKAVEVSAYPSRPCSVRRVSLCKFMNTFLGFVT